MISQPQNDNAGRRDPPSNIEAEMALLGAILVNNEACDRVSQFLTPDHFCEGIHARIYDAASSLIRMGKLASPITLRAFFDNDQTLKEIGGPAYLARLASNATTIINAEEYGRTVYHLAQYRQLINIGTDLVNSAFAPSIDNPPQSIIEACEGALYSVATTERHGSGFVSMASALTQSIEMASNAYQRDGGLSGLSTGLIDLDARLGGLQPSDLIVLAGRPSMGKTALGTNIAFNVAKSHQRDSTGKTINGGVVAFFSLEMSAEQLATRIMSEQSEISSEIIRRGKIDDRQFNRLVDTCRAIEHLPLYIDAQGNLTVHQVAARARRIKRQRGLDLIVVDYLQLLRGTRKSTADSRVNEITDITTSLKALAKELNIPVLALSQLSRQVETREDKHPQLSDLRESGSIEQDADVVMFVYREEYYMQRTEPRPGTPEHVEWQDKMDKVNGIAEIIIGKQRHGPTGTVELMFDSRFTRFRNLVTGNNIDQGELL